MSDLGVFRKVLALHFACRCDLNAQATSWSTLLEVPSHFVPQEWSFTDCVSFGTMRELRVRDAFTTDHHIKLAGFVPLLK
jgi:predicted nucleic acid-binding protein